jgi:hypothetical protein
MRASNEHRRAHHRLDRGGASVEYVIVLLLVAVLVLVLIPVVTGLGSTLGYHLCRTATILFGGDEATAAERCGPEPDPVAGAEDPPPTDEDFAPGLCQVRSSTEARGLRAQVIASYNGETAMSRIDMADGSVWYVAEPWSESYGASLGFGAAVPLGHPAIWGGGWAHLDGAYDTGHSMIWTFDAEDHAAAEAFEEQLREDTAIGSNPFSMLWNEVTGWFGADNDLDLPEPDMEIDLSGWSGTLTAGPELIVGPVYTAPRMLEVDGGAVRTVRTDYGGSLYYPEGGGQDIISENHQISGTVTGDGMILLGGAAGAGGGAGWSAGIRADRHEDGELQGIYLNASFEKEAHLRAANPFGFGVRRAGAVQPDASYETGVGEVQNTYVWIGFDNDEERAIGEQFLSEYGGHGGAFNYFWETMNADHGFLDEDPGPGADPWEQLVYDKAFAWQTTGRSEASSASLGIDGMLGQFPIGFNVTAGLGWNSSSLEQTTGDAWHLGAPGEDGTREYLTHEDCIT